MPKENSRQLSLKSMGGTKSVHSLPRADRALVLASLMQEAPAKRESETACAFSAFKDAVEKEEPLRAFKIFDKHKLDASGRAEKIRALVSAKIKKLNAEGKDEYVNSFAIMFLKDEGAISCYSARASEVLASAKKEMQMGDPRAGYHIVFLKEIIDAEATHGMSIHTREAATLLAILYLRGENFGDAVETINQHLINGGRELAPEERSGLVKEIGVFLYGGLDTTLESTQSYIVETAKRNPAILALCQEAISATIPKNPELAAAERIMDALKTSFDLACLFDMHEEAKKVGISLANAYIEQASPDMHYAVGYKSYLEAARVARKLGDIKWEGECVSNFLECCEKLGENDPSMYAEGFEAAQEFSVRDKGILLGEKAFLGFLSQGKYEEAEQIATDMTCDKMREGVIPSELERRGREMLQTLEKMRMRLV